MASYKEPGFAERTALAQRAKQEVLDRLRVKPAVDPAVLAERRAREEERAAAAAEARRLRLEERERKKAEKAEQALVAKAAKPESAPRDEAALKAARDARYAARKARRS